MGCGANMKIISACRKTLGLLRGGCPQADSGSDGMRVRRDEKPQKLEKVANSHFFGTLDYYLI